MSTKTNTSKPETATEITKSVEVVNQAAETANKAGKAVSGLFGAYFASSRKLIEGVIEVDKALFGYAKDAVTGYVDLGKETFQAKCLNDVIDLHAAYAHSRIETTAANAREVVELTKDKAKEAYAPMKEVIDTYRPGKAA